jgi:GNAT superfamily N-acetyltransferase
MLFATASLAARIERAECGLLLESVEAISTARPDADLFARPLAGGVAIYVGDGAPLNKVAGLGFGGPVDEGELGEVERLYAARGAAVQVELSSLGEPSVGTLLTARGYRLVGFEGVLGRPLSEQDLETLPASGADIVVRPSGAAEAATWLDTVVTGFLHADTEGVPSHESFTREVLEEVMGDMTRAEGLLRYLALRSGEPAGGASMRLDQGVAQLCGAATLPAHRRQGVQAALLARRLDDATRAGCDVAVVTTQPGSTSQKNAHRRGFELLDLRAVLVLAAPAA